MGHGPALLSQSGSFQPLRLLCFPPSLADTLSVWPLANSLGSLITWSDTPQTEHACPVGHLTPELWRKLQGRQAHFLMASVGKVLPSRMSNPNRNTLQARETFLLPTSTLRTVRHNDNRILTKSASLVLYVWVKHEETNRTT